MDIITIFLFLDIEYIYLLSAKRKYLYLKEQ